VFGGQTIAGAMIDRIDHHPEIHTVTGDSCRSEKWDIGTLANLRPENKSRYDYQWRNF